MRTGKNLGIWMDHANAHLIEFTADSLKTAIIGSSFTHEQKDEALHKSENLMHNKEQHQQTEYYKKLGDKMRDYDEVLLFGPTDAKMELLNFLRTDHCFSKIKITMKPTDKMTENQEHAFVKEHFAKH